MKKIFKSLLALFVLALSGYLLVLVNKIDILPTKYFILFFFIIAILNIIGGITLFVKSKWPKIITAISYVILVGISILGVSYGLDTLDFLNKSFNNNETEIAKYEIVVLKSANITSIGDLKNAIVGYLDEGGSSENQQENTTKVLDNIQKQVSVQFKSYEDMFNLYDDLIAKKIEAFVLNSGYLEELRDEHNNLDDLVNIIYSFEVEEKIEKKETKKAKLEPMSIYLSGSDSRSNTIQNKSRSDVNMIITFNPNTKTVLLTSIPRDYYVDVHGKTGLKDKLTHSGIYGIDVSRKTVEDLFDIDIAYSIKVGMPAVKEIVDLVGGVDITSDIEFRSSHIPSWTVKKGVNHMDGAQALAYSRERYAYASGDRHRILNQQQVLEAVLNKIVKDKTILTKYDKLLDSVSNLYRTDIPKEIITELVKKQLDDMSGWTFMSNSVSGSDASRETYTAPHSKRYVMIPYPEDVTSAHNKIEQVLKGTN